jgi:hypothetical protein
VGGLNLEEEGENRSMQALVGGAGRCSDLIGERLFWVALGHLGPELCSAFETVAIVRPGIFSLSWAYQREYGNRQFNRCWT